MTQPNDGGAKATDEKNGGASTNEDNNNDGRAETDVQKRLEEMQTQLELLKKESSGKDRKISDFLKEKEAIELANKTEKEQLEFYKNQITQFERKEAFRQSFKEIGLNPDEFMGIIDEKSPKIQSEKFAALLKIKAEESAKNALEKFKTDELEKKGGIPNPTDGDRLKADSNISVNTAIRNAFGR